ncbi:unnamed protein product, partial [Symbiodinium pilosum]
FVLMSRLGTKISAFSTPSTPGIWMVALPWRSLWESRWFPSTQSSPWRARHRREATPSSCQGPMDRKPGPWSWTLMWERMRLESSAWRCTSKMGR